MNQGEVARVFEDIRTQFTDFITNYPFVVVIVVGIIIVLIFVNRLTPVLRVKNAVSRIQGYLNTGELRSDIYPISYWVDNKPGDYRAYVDTNNEDEVPTKGTGKGKGKTFKDYHIMSSAKSYLVKNRHYDFCSLRVLQSILLYGAKFVELDIFNAGFGEDMSYPVVTNGEDRGEWKTCINKLSFEECCNTVLKYGIEYWKQNWTNADPVFMYLNCHSLRKDTVDKMAEIIYRVFSDTYLTDLKFGNANGTIIDNPPEMFYNKVIIVTNIGRDSKNPSTPKFNEKINLLTTPKLKKFKAISYQEGDIESMKKEDNDSKLCMIYDNSPGNELVNFNPIIPWIKGVQFIAMHFQSNDTNMKQYLKMFSLQYPDSTKKRDKFIVNTSYRLKKVNNKSGT